VPTEINFYYRESQRPQRAENGRGNNPLKINELQKLNVVNT